VYQHAAMLTTTHGAISHEGPNRSFAPPARYITVRCVLSYLDPSLTDATHYAWFYKFCIMKENLILGTNSIFT
jgi:hypothetical protein